MKKLFVGVLYGALSLSCPAAADLSSVGKPVHWTTPDGVVIQGRFEPGRAPDRRVWILLHGLGSNQNEWWPLAHPMVARGFGILTYDARGHGESTRRKGGKVFGYPEFRTSGPGSDWQKMAADVESAVRYLTEQKKISRQQIGLIGASLGANVALTYSAGHSKVPAVILLSPGLDYAGVTTEPVLANMRPRPVLFVVSPGDRYAFQSVQRLRQKCDWASCLAFVADGSGHGVGMLSEPLIKSLIDWMEKN